MYKIAIITPKAENSITTASVDVFHAEVLRALTEVSKHATKVVTAQMPMTLAYHQPGKLVEIRINISSTQILLNSQLLGEIKTNDLITQGQAIINAILEPRIEAKKIDPEYKILGINSHGQSNNHKMLKSEYDTHKENRTLHLVFKDYITLVVGVDHVDHYERVEVLNLK